MNSENEDEYQIEIIPEQEKVNVDTGFAKQLEANFLGVLSREFKRIDKFENALTIIEDRLLDPTVLSTVVDYDRLIKLYDFIDKKKLQKQYFTVKLLEATSKNAILSKVITDLIEVSKQSKSPGKVDPKIETIVNMVKKAGINKIHGAQQIDGPSK